MQSKMFTLAGVAALALGACTVQEDKDKTAGQEVAESGGVTREAMKSEEPEGPPVTPMPAATVIQSQPGPDGSQVDLKPTVPSGLFEAEKALAGVAGIDFVRFSGADVVRHPVVGRIIEAYDTHRAGAKQAG